MCGIVGFAGSEGFHDTDRVCVLIGPRHSSHSRVKIY